MRRSFLALLLLSGCFVRPVAMQSSWLPPVTGETASVRVESQQCVPYLFGMIPLARIRNLDEVIESAAGGRRNQLHGVTVESKTIVWLLGVSRCIRVAGYKVDQPAGDAPVVSRQVPDQEIEAQRLLLYKVAGREPDPSNAARDAQAILDWLASGKREDEMMAVVATSGGDEPIYIILRRASD